MILVTGGTGYVGQEICAVLERSGEDYRALARQKSGPKDISFDLLQGEERELQNILADTEKVIHCAWYVERKDYLHSKENYKWHAATLRLVHNLQPNQLSHFLALGTCLEYKSSPEVKQINSPLEADSPYADAKIATFKSLETQLQEKRIAFAWCRLFHLFGGNEHKDRLIPTVQRCIQDRIEMRINTGCQIIDLSHVSDLAQGIAQISMQSRAGIFNMCSGTGQSVKEIVLSRCNSEMDRDLFTFGGAAAPNLLVGKPNFKA